MVDSSGARVEEIAAAGREVQRLSRLVDGLLTLSRADGPPPNRRAVDIDKVIQDRCDASSALAAERRVELDAPSLAGGRAVASVVPGDLEQILRTEIVDELRTLVRSAA